MKRPSVNESSCRSVQSGVGTCRDKRVLVLFLFVALILAITAAQQLLSENKTATQYTCGDLVVPNTNCSQSTARPCSPLTSQLLQQAFPINVATQEELELLPGIGPRLAAQIVEYRTTHGSFTKTDELLNVPGIGKALLNRLNPLFEEQQ